MCGYSLPTAASGAVEPARVANPPIRVQSGLNKAGIAVLLLGAAVTVLGAIGLFLLGALGLAILVPGLFLVMVGMNSAGRTTTGAMPLTGWIPTNRSWIRRRRIEEAEERDKESGAAD